MFDPDAIERIRREREEWEARELRDFLARQPEARPEARTGSGLPVKRVYTDSAYEFTRRKASGNSR